MILIFFIFVCLFVFITFLIEFFFNSTPGHFISNYFCIKFSLHSFNCHFFYFEGFFYCIFFSILSPGTLLIYNFFFVVFKVCFIWYWSQGHKFWKLTSVDFGFFIGPSFKIDFSQFHHWTFDLLKIDLCIFFLFPFYVVGGLTRVDMNLFFNCFLFYFSWFRSWILDCFVTELHDFTQFTFDEVTLILLPGHGFDMLIRVKLVLFFRHFLRCQFFYQSIYCRYIFLFVLFKLFELIKPNRVNDWSRRYVLAFF